MTKEVETGRANALVADSATDELDSLRREVRRLSAENGRLLRLLELTPRQARSPEPAQTAIFEVAPGAVRADSPAAAKVAFYAALFGARTDTYALRWDNPRLGRGGWVPAVQGGWRKNQPSGSRTYLPLTAVDLASVGQHRDRAVPDARR